MPKKFTLEELLAGVTPENVHHEVDWGRAQGKEAWQPLHSNQNQAGCRKRQAGGKLMERP
jgi:hypothetical protein